MTDNHEVLLAAWSAVAPRYEAYAPVLPGDSAFICQPHACDAYCCRTMSVSLGDREADRMAAASGRSRVQFLECEDGEPIELPLLKPYLLARSDAACAMLASLSCGEYEGRPDACRQYPHQVLFIDATRGRQAVLDAGERDEAILRTLDGGPLEPAAVAFLVRHTPCPGFTGPPIDRAAWRDLFLATAGLQFDGVAARPGL